MSSLPINVNDEAVASLLRETPDASALDLLRQSGVSHPARAAEDLRRVAVDPEIRPLVAALLPDLLCQLADAADPDRALNSIERMTIAAKERHRLLRTLAEDPAAVRLLCQVTGSSQYFADTLAREPHLLGWLRSPGVLESPLGSGMQRELAAAMAASDAEQWPAVMRRFKRHHMLRIGAMDLLGRAELEQVTGEISALAEAEIEAAIRYARQTLSRRYGPPLDEAGDPITLVVLGLGKLGGYELNYSSDIDLIILYGAEGRASKGADDWTTAREYFARMARTMVKALDEVTAEGQVFRTDMRLRPDGSQGELALSYARTLRYYRDTGRTWERQALLKARPVAGDILLGRRFLAEVQPFMYRRYLTLESISEIRQLKSVMESTARENGVQQRGVKQGIGGIRDIEFTVQFLQLLHGGQYPALQVTGTLAAIGRLRQARVLMDEEAETLRSAYRYLRNLEHRLQILHDLQRYALPEDPQGRAFIARQMNYRDGPEATALEAFEQDFARTQKRVRRVFQRLFGTGFHEEGTDAEALTELILAPHLGVEDGKPSEAALRILSRFGLQHTRQAHKRLVSLTREESALLKTTRTRTALAKCAPALFAQLSHTLDPDLALGQLERIVDSIGGKTVFYEMLAESPALLRMVVHLAIYSQFLTDLLVRHPGMFDELLDSLQTGHKKTQQEMHAELTELLRGAVDPDAIIKSFQAGELLRIGVRDLLHKANLGETFHELSSLADTILDAVINRVMAGRGDTVAPEGRDFAVIGLGKLGGRELTYGSDLDLIFVHANADPRQGARYAYLGQVVVRTVSGVTEHGKLYDIDMRLRPMGRSSPLVPSLERYREYARTKLEFWERLALTRARFVAGDPDLGWKLQALCRQISYGLDGVVRDEAMLSPEAARREVAHLRRRIQDAAHPESVKKGHGGLVDVEFIVQLLQVIHGADHPTIRKTNTYDGLKAIHEAGLLATGAYLKLLDAYRFLRTVESRLRIVHGSSVDRLPQNADDLELLARRAGYEPTDTTRAAESLLDEYRYHTKVTRELFAELVGEPE